MYQSVTAGKTPATLVTWYADDIDQIVAELVSSGVEFIRHDEFEHDAKGITARAGGGRIAWFQDRDGNTFALEADDGFPWGTWTALRTCHPMAMSSSIRTWPFGHRPRIESCHPSSSKTFQRPQ